MALHHCVFCYQVLIPLQADENKRAMFVQNFPADRPKEEIKVIA